MKKMNKCVDQCARKKIWTVENDWKEVIYSDESQIVIGNDCRVYIWRKSYESWLPDCISPGTTKKISVMIWGCITYHVVGTFDRVNGNINSEKYIDILDNNMWPVVARHFPDNTCTIY